MSLRTSVSLLALLLISNQTYAASPRIVGGQPSSVGHWPYLMHIVDDSVSSADYQHICGGGYLGDGLAVTARHCIFADKVLTQKVCIGNLDTLNRNNCYPIIAYKRFDNAQAQALLGTENISGDIALLKLDGVPEELPAMTWPSQELDSSLAPQETLTLLGYGSTSYDSYQPASQLRQLDAQRLPSADCESTLKLSAGKLPADHICIQQAKVGSAPGDSGTPNFFWRNGAPIPVGLVSSGENFIVSYVRYAIYHSWLSQVAAEWLPASTPMKEHYRLLLPSDNSNSAAPVLTLPLRNWSDTPVAFNLQRETASQFATSGTPCQQIDAQGLCLLPLYLAKANKGHTRETIPYQLGQTSQSQIVTTDLAVPLTPPGNWVAPNVQWWSGGPTPWAAMALAPDTTLSNVPLDTQENSDLVAQLQGPGTLSFKLDSLGRTSLSGLVIRLDENTTHLLNNYCIGQTYSIEIPVGEHRVTWHAYNHEVDQVGTISNLSEVRWPDGVTSTAEPYCRNAPKYTVPDNPANDVIQPDSGGGTFGWLGLGVLGALAWFRRKPR